MVVFRRFIWLVLPMLVLGCGREERLETAFRLAGDNAGELRNVIAHYSSDPADSLKLKAAVFLIENMPGHISVDSAKMGFLYDSVNALLDVRFKMKNNRDTIMAFVNSLTYSDSLIVKDVETVTSDFLIRNIDSSFVAWNKPWARHMSFEQFCEYILPYKFAEYQRLDSWRDSLKKRFYPAVERYTVNDRDYQYAFRIGKILNTEFNAKLKPSIQLKSIALGNISPFFNSGSVARISFGDCNDYALVNVAMMRSAGVPAVFEYTPQWGERASGRHGWSTIYNNNGFVPIPHTDKDPGEPFFPTRKLPKIFRWQYAPVPEREEYVKNAAYVHYDLAQFEKDVTSEYLPTSDVAVPVDTKGLADKYAYIAVTNLRSWNVVDFGIIKGKNAYFRNMGRDMVYLAYGYDGKTLIPISDPFIIHNNGNVVHLKADTTSLDTVKLWRKYPRSENTVKMENRIIGGKIQASTDSLFTVDTTFYEIKDLYYPDLIPIVSDSAYRFWRYLAPRNAAGNIAELQFYRAGVDSTLKGEIYGPAGVRDGHKREHAFDGDWLTYYNSSWVSAQAWVAMDFGEPVTIDSVRCVPRSDDNGIHYGDVYELVYCVDGNWVSRPQQTARERYLIFDSVPRNSLMLLKNVSRGKEERPFTYVDGKQVWW